MQAERASDWDAALLHYENVYDSTPCTPEEYVRRAVEFARDPQRLARVRSVLRDRTLAAWCDKTAYTREFEEQLRKAVAACSLIASPPPA